MRLSPLLTGTLAVGLLAGAADAQARGEAPRARAYIQTGADDERPVIGVNTSSSSERDTLGLLVVAVTPDGPAERAGIEEGNRIAEVNGVSLRLAPADAGHDDMDGLTTRRLIRELRKVEPGAEVDLRIYANGQLRSVKLKTVAAEDLPRVRNVSRNDEERPVLGVGLNPTGSRRDTLGVLITMIATDGPAEKAGLIEGDRIAAINGVDLRVPGSEAGEGALSRAKSNRFSRELRKLKPGDEVELRIYSAGQFRNVRIKTQAAEDVYDEERNWNSFFGSNLRVPRVMGEDGERFRVVVPRRLPPDVRMRTPAPVIIPVPAPPPQQLQLRGREAPRGRDRTPLVNAGYTPDASALTGRSFARSGAQLRPVQQVAVPVEQAARGEQASSRVVVGAGSGQHYVIELPGLQLAKISTDLADYLGAGAEDGLLVLEVDDVWAPLRIGDVVLAVNGRPVRRGDAASVALDTSGTNTIDVIRRGRHVTLLVDCR